MGDILDAKKPFAKQSYIKECSGQYFL